MRTSEERVEELHRRMASHRHARMRRSRMTAASAAAACLAAVVLLALGVSRSEAAYPGGAGAGMTASIFAGHGALGFVSVALVAFCLGALVTILCYRLKENGENGETRNDRRP